MDSEPTDPDAPEKLMTPMTPNDPRAYLSQKPGSSETGLSTPDDPANGPTNEPANAQQRVKKVPLTWQEMCETVRAITWVDKDTEEMIVDLEPLVKGGKVTTLAQARALFTTPYGGDYFYAGWVPEDWRIRTAWKIMSEGW